jgi:hypothetical protein
VIFLLNKSLLFFSKQTQWQRRVRGFDRELCFESEQVRFFVPRTQVHQHELCFRVRDDHGSQIDPMRMHPFLGIRQRMLVS